MKIYIGHSRDYDYQNKLYSPIRNDKELQKYEIILPHENNNSILYSKDFYSSIDLFIAEVSLPATGLGIELGFAKRDNTNIVCISNKDTKLSSSLKAVTDKFYTYSSNDELLIIIKQIIKEYENEENNNANITINGNNRL